MKQNSTKLGAVAPTQLKEARIQAHYGVQWVSRAARANLATADDDSHSNLGWDADRRALICHGLVTPDDETVHVGLDIAGMRLFLAGSNGVSDELMLNGHGNIEAGEWLDGQLHRFGLQPAGAVELPYGLDDHALGQGAGYTAGSHAAELAELAAWFALAADALETVRATLGHLSPAPSPVRCWPHHFDIATLLSLEEGDAETARAIGIGMSPGDDGYVEPYVYINPWPHLAPQDLPELPPPGHWHIEGFVGAVATATEILTLDNHRDGLIAFIAGATEAGRRNLGI
jgi:hypothetical protein